MAHTWKETGISQGKELYKRASRDLIARLDCALTAALKGEVWSASYTLFACPANGISQAMEKALCLYMVLHGHEIINLHYAHQSLISMQFCEISQAYQKHSHVQ